MAATDKLSTVNAKPAVQSKGMWGASIATIAGLALTISQLVGNPDLIALVPPQYVGIAVTIGGGLAWFGRKFATQKIANGGSSL